MIPDALCQRCQEEHTKFRHNLRFDPGQCYSLLRLALQEANQFAQTCIFRIYHAQVRNWISRTLGEHDEFDLVNTLVSATFQKFLTSITGAKFNDFQDLPRLMQYLRRCAVSNAIDYLRRKPDETIVDTAIEEMAESLASPGDDFDEVDRRLDSAALWKYIQTLIPDKDEWDLFVYYFVEDLKPGEIYELEAKIGVWESPRSISVALQRLKYVLSHDPRLRRWVRERSTKNDSENWF